MTRALFAVLLLATSVALSANRTPEHFALDFTRANGMAEAGKRAEAIALYESLLSEQPENGELNFRYGGALYMHSVTAGLASPAANERRRQARAALLKAQSADFHDPLLDQFLAAIKPDGSIDKAKYSAVPAAEAAMHEAEVAFAKREVDAAFAAYQRALKFDPGLYPAALFSGDCLFVAGKFDEAIVWFHRATEIDPDQESAYRYWADALAKQGKVREALVQLTEALVANPYTGYAWRTMKAIAGPAGRLRSQPALLLPVASIDWDEKAKKAGIGLREKFNPFDLVYAAGRAEWLEREFAPKQGSTTYRHSLPEEVAGLTTFVKVAKELEGKTNAPPDYAKALNDMKPAVARLSALAEEGLLEPFVLFFRADDGIMQDYAAYRAAHREKLREFVRRYMVNID